MADDTPPPDFSVDALTEIAAGTGLYRVHHTDFAGAAFNPCKGAPSRFAPIHTPAGVCIPTLYAARTLDAAAYETIFRGVPGPFAAIPRFALNARAVSRIAPRRPLRLVPMFAPELRGWGLDPRAVFAPSGPAYRLCRALAAGAWRDNPQAHGLIWTWVRDDSAKAMMLFGDRVGADDIDTLSTRAVHSDEAVLDALRKAGRRAGWIISR